VNRRIMAICSMIAIALVLGTGPVPVSAHRTEQETLPPSLLGPAGQTTDVSPEDAIWHMLGRVNRARAVADLRRFAGEEPICTTSGCQTILNRRTGSEGLRWTMDYIFEELADLGYVVEFEDWTRKKRSDRNLIARKVGMIAPTEEVYIVSHVDGANEGDEERFSSAEDNATGAVDLLETARVLSTYSFSRTLVLFFSTGEEQGASGVRSHLDQLSAAELSRITVAVDVDMVGYDANEDRLMELWHGDDPVSMPVTRIMSETIRTYQLDLLPLIIAGCG